MPWYSCGLNIHSSCRLTHVHARITLVESFSREGDAMLCEFNANIIKILRFAHRDVSTFSRLFLSFYIYFFFFSFNRAPFHLSLSLDETLYSETRGTLILSSQHSMLHCDDETRNLELSAPFDSPPRCARNFVAFPRRISILADSKACDKSTPFFL